MSKRKASFFPPARTIWNCDAFEFHCPNSWEALAMTDTPNVRHCAECRKNVYQCWTPDEFVEHGQLGHCVAVPRQFSQQGAQLMMLGQPSADEVRGIEKRHERMQAFWGGVLGLNPEFGTED